MSLYKRSPEMQKDGNLGLPHTTPSPPAPYIINMHLKGLISINCTQNRKQKKEKGGK